MILTIKFTRAIIMRKYDNRYQIEDKMSKYKTKQRDEILRLFMDNEGKCMSAREVCSVVTAGEATVFPYALVSHRGRASQKIQRRLGTWGMRVLSAQLLRRGPYSLEMRKVRQTDTHGLRIYGNNIGALQKRARLYTRLQKNRDIRLVQRLCGKRGNVK